MSSLRELKARIKSVNSSQKITGAMKMISSARLRKAENALYNSRPYLEEIHQLLDRVTAQQLEYSSPLAEEREINSVAVVVIGSESGLCGSFNLFVYKKFLETINDYRAVNSIKVYPIGRKILSEIRKIGGLEIMRVPEGIVGSEFMSSALTLADDLIEQFVSKKIDRIEVVYAHFKSIGTQIPMRLQLLPWRRQNEQLSEKELNRIYIYEPNCTSILDMLYPLGVRSIFSQSLLESRTSEQAARIISMQIANDNAMKLLKELQLEYNKLRQQNITAELLDIVGGVAE